MAPKRVTRHLHSFAGLLPAMPSSKRFRCGFFRRETPASSATLLQNTSVLPYWCTFLFAPMSAQLSAHPLTPDSFPPLSPNDLLAGFALDSNGHVTVDGVSVSSVAQLINEDHFFLLSLSRIVNNTREYAQPLLPALQNCNMSSRYKDAVSELLPGMFVLFKFTTDNPLAITTAFASQRSQGLHSRLRHQSKCKHHCNQVSVRAACCSNPPPHAILKQAPCSLRLRRSVGQRQRASPRAVRRNSRAKNRSEWKWQVRGGHPIRRRRGMHDQR